jgi:methylmalonyl-CoA mutase
LPHRSGALAWENGLPAWDCVAWAGAVNAAGFEQRAQRALAGGADAVAGSGTTWPVDFTPPLVLVAESPDPPEFTLAQRATGAWIWRPSPLPDSLDAWATAVWRATHDAGIPRVRTLSIDLSPFANQSLPMQTALALALLRRYLDAADDQRRGDLLDRIQLVVPIGPAFFPEVARLRALRIVAKAVFRAYGITAGGRAISILAETACDTGPDPSVHALRATPMALSAVLGGCSALLVHPGTPNEERTGVATDRLARNTALILKHEAFLDGRDDPAAGAYFIEHLTDGIARRAWALFQELERRGSVPTDRLAAFEAGARAP